MKTIAIVLSSLFSLNILAQNVPCSSTIRVGTSCTGHSCTTASVNVVAFNTYTANVLTNEWGQWGAWPDGDESLKAGAVAIRSYALNRIIYPISAHGNNSNYDICNNTYCHVYNSSVTPSTYATSAVSNTGNSIIVTSGGNIAQTEFAAETNDNCSPVQTSGNYCGQCGDGKFQRSVTGPPINGGGCYPSSGTDPVCIGKTNSGHPRGMCQRGSVRWATGYTVPSNTNMGSPHSHGTKTWQQLLDYYYPYWSRSTCDGGTLPPPNDDCADAINITNNNCTNPESGDVDGATSSGISIPNCSGSTSSAANDVWYYFTAQSEEAVVAIWDPSPGFDGVLAVYSSSCGSLNLEGCIDDGGGAGQEESIAFTNLTVNDEYYVRVYEYNTAGSTTTFDLCVTFVPPDEVDLTVQSLTTEPSNLFTCEEIDLCAIIENIGPGDATNEVRWEYSIDGDYIDDDTDPSIDAGSTVDECEINYVFDNPGTYQFCVTIDNYSGETITGNNTSCITLTVAQGPLPDEPIINNDNPVSFCTGSNTTLTVSNPCGGCTYDWSDGTNNSESITVSTDGTYSVTVTNLCGSASTSVTVTETSIQPAPTINGDTCFHPGESTTLRIGDVCGGCIYQWSDNSTADSITVNAAGAYSVTVTGNCGTATEQVAVIVLDICPGINSVNSFSNFLVFPNPNTGSFTVQLETKTSQEIQISIMNLLGQNIYETEAQKISGEYRRDIDLRDVAAGMYFVNVRVGEETVSEKIIIRQ